MLEAQKSQMMKLGGMRGGPGGPAGGGRGFGGGMMRGGGGRPGPYDRMPGPPGGPQFGRGYGAFGPGGRGSRNVKSKFNVFFMRQDDVFMSINYFHNNIVNIPVTRCDQISPFCQFF